MKSQVRATEVNLMAKILEDLHHCSTAQSIVRDCETLQSRVEHEGLSFLTITLPRFGDEFFLSLSHGRIDPTYFQGFKKHGAIPAFLQGMVGQVFDVETGTLLMDPNIGSIEGVRQVSYTFKKLKMPCTPARTRKAEKEFINVERQLQDFVGSNEETFDIVSRYLWSRLDYGFNSFELVPKHGPGSTCERIYGNQKYDHREWYERIDQFFPFHHFAYTSEWCDEELEKVRFVPENDERPVRVIAVPKTLKTPRIIAIEPVCMQYAQQAVASYLIQRLERHDLVKGHINFTDQKTNRELAMNASTDMMRATIDLSSASDRVPLVLVSRMLHHSPNLLRAICACRSTRANVRGEIINLKKFASMGSALCFPIEAMYFYTVCVVGLLRCRKEPVTSEYINNACSEVYVYGDDILVPTNSAVDVMQTLQEYNCKVNTNKSFWTGKFRESCGLDAYDGVDVTPTYIRQTCPTSRRSAGAIAAWVSTSNQFYKRGYWKTADLLRTGVEKAVGIKLPTVGPCCAGLGWTSFQGWIPDRGRWNNDLQRYEVKTLVVSNKSQDDKIDSYAALTKVLLSLRMASDAKMFFSQENHRAEYVALEDEDNSNLNKTKLRGQVTTKFRWVRPY